MNSQVSAPRKDITSSSRLSPMSVLELAFDVLDNDETPAMEKTSFMLFSRRSLCPEQCLMPPLDQVTTCSDDSTSVSSISSDEGETTSLQPAPRSIFKKYWDKKGGATCIQRTPPTEPLYSNATRALAGTDDVDTIEEQSSAANTYERTLKVSECVKKVEEPSVSRRRIFDKGCLGHSAPALSIMPQVTEIRKSQSAEAIGSRRPKESCLRKPRYSGSFRREEEGSSSADTSVRFHKNVDIIVYQPPVEKWAADGWSAWFS